MCVDPVTATLVGTTVLGAVTSAQGAYQSSRATAAADKANADQDKAQAAATLNQTTAAVDQATRRFELNQGKVRNIIGNSGIAPSSFQAVIDDDTAEAAIERATIRYNGGLQQQQLLYKSRMDEASAANAKTAGNIGVVSAIVGGGKSLAQLSNANRTPAITSGWDATVTYGDGDPGGVAFNTYD